MMLNLIGLLYALIIVLANTVGAVSGMGGGVIIKPVFDVIGIHSVAAISFYSSTAVFMMALVSTYCQVKQGMQLPLSKVVPLSIGALLGGVLGNSLLSWLLATFPNERLVLLVQIVLTIVSLLFAFVYTRYHLSSFGFSRRLAYLLCGLILGTLASLLGIGGGPINVSLLMLLFALPIKEATVYSIATILFSQIAKLFTIAIQGKLGEYDLSLLAYILPAAMLGGFLGAYLSKRLSVNKVETIFQLVLLLVIAINLYNLIRLFPW